LQFAEHRETSIIMHCSAAMVKGERLVTRIQAAQRDAESQGWGRQWAGDKIARVVDGGRRDARRSVGDDRIKIPEIERI